METKFGIGWSVKQIKQQMTQNWKIFCCNQMKKIKNYSQSKEQKKANWYKCESMERSCESI